MDFFERLKVLDFHELYEDYWVSWSWRNSIERHTTEDYLHLTLRLPAIKPRDGYGKHFLFAVLGVSSMDKYEELYQSWDKTQREEFVNLYYTTATMLDIADFFAGVISPKLKQEPKFWTEVIENLAKKVYNSDIFGLYIPEVVVAFNEDWGSDKLVFSDALANQRLTMMASRIAETRLDPTNDNIDRLRLDYACHWQAVPLSRDEARVFLLRDRWVKPGTAKMTVYATLALANIFYTMGYMLREAGLISVIESDFDITKDGKYISDWEFECHDNRLYQNSYADYSAWGENMIKAYLPLLFGSLRQDCLYRRRDRDLLLGGLDYSTMGKNTNGYTRVGSSTLAWDYYPYDWSQRIGLGLRYRYQKEEGWNENLSMVPTCALHSRDAVGRIRSIMRQARDGVD